MDDNRDVGPQPLDVVMIQLKVSNTDLVKVSTKQLTHKMVQKGRKGCKLTVNTKMKILQALHAACLEQKFKLSDLFNY